MTTYTNPIFRPVRARHALSVSAADGLGRWNLGEISIEHDGLRFSPNNVRTGGADAEAAVTRWIGERKNELLDMLSSLYDPTMDSDRRSLNLIAAFRAT